MSLLAWVAAATLAVPEQVHIAFKNDTVLWVSWLDSASVSEGRVMVNGAVAASNVPPSTYTFQSAAKETPYTSPSIFHAVVPVSCGGGVIKYSVSSNGSTWSQQFTTKTLPCVSADAPLVVGLLGDLGQTVNSSSTVDHFYSGMTQQEAPIQMGWLVGDLSYADSAWYPDCRYPDACNQRRWDSWGRMVEKIAARVPFMTCPGNHEIEYDPKPAIGTPYMAYESRMRAADNGNQPYWWSMNAGPAHFISLNSYMDYSVQSEQYKWLVKDLQSVDRSVTPWVFVGLHAPWYNSNKHHQKEREETGMRAAMEPVLHQYSVDVLFCGHVHAYERTYPIYNGTRLEGAMTEINIGDGGNREVLEADPYDWLQPQPEWSAFRQNKFGHGRLQIFNSTHAGWSWHTIDTPESIVSDRVMFVKNTRAGRGVEAFPLD